MSASVLVEAIGDIEVDIDEAVPEQTLLHVPVSVQGGAAFVLQLKRREIHQLWEFLAALKQSEIKIRLRRFYIVRNRQPGQICCKGCEPDLSFETDFAT